MKDIWTGDEGPPPLSTSLARTMSFSVRPVQPTLQACHSLEDILNTACQYARSRRCHEIKVRTPLSILARRRPELSVLSLPSSS
jgi:hypothetical protein